jgi:hypothetical protein
VVYFTNPLNDYTLEVLCEFPVDQMVNVCKTPVMSALQASTIGTYKAARDLRGVVHGIPDGTTAPVMPELLPDPSLVDGTISATIQPSVN